MESSQVLRVNTFGGFSMIWQGISIGAGVKSSDSQFTRLMEILLHYRTQGVDRVQMQDLLFEDSGSDDIHHLLRTVIYNARRKLREAGLPGPNYIEFRDGSYYWVNDIPVEEDATEFEQIYEDAKKETNPERRTELLIDACYFYKGDFLPQQTRLLWVAEEERKYRNMFSYCMDNAVQALREQHSWAELERLGRHASSVSPLDEWETVTMEALMAMGKAKAAQQLYEETVDFYQKELGVSSSLDIVGRLEIAASGIDQPYTQMDRIIEQLNEPEDEIIGGYFCSYHIFRRIYRLIGRTTDRYGVCAFLMICSIIADDQLEECDAAGFDYTGINVATEKMKSIILRSVRKSDIVCRYGQGKFLMMLMNHTSDSCDVVKERINMGLQTEGLDITVEFRTAPI